MKIIIKIILKIKIIIKIIFYNQEFTNISLMNNNRRLNILLSWILILQIKKANLHLLIFKRQIKKIVQIFKKTLHINKTYQQIKFKFLHKCLLKNN